jgi:SAM-dependent methyltransferase
MNLFEMATRKDPNLELLADAIILPTGAAPAHDDRSTLLVTKQRFNSRTVRGIHVSAAAAPAKIRIKSIFSYYPFSHGGRDTHWVLATLTTRHRCTVSISLRQGTSTVAETLHRPSLGDELRIELPQVPEHLESERKTLDLEISISDTGRRGVLLIDHDVMSRARVISLCVGTGVEIGPGTNPQIRPSSTTQVAYIEQSAPEQWSQLYVRGKAIDQSLWANYRIGEAHLLPVEAHSLDFVFSSHVFEHLANPLGHLEYWKTTLRPGGKIVAVIPTVTGCKDYVFAPCGIDDLVSEYTQRIWEPTHDHYVRWARYRAPTTDPEVLRTKKRSIHVHFYDAANVTALLQWAVTELGYRSFEIEYVANHKDMHFVLTT